MANKNIKTNLKRAALTAAATAVMGMATPARATNATVQVKDTTKTVQKNNAARREVIGVVLKTEWIEQQAAVPDAKLLAFYLDTDNDGLVDHISYFVVTKGFDYVLNAKIPVQITEEQDANGRWYGRRFGSLNERAEIMQMQGKSR